MKVMKRNCNFNTEWSGPLMRKAQGSLRIMEIQKGDLIDVQRHFDKNSENRGKRILHVYRIKMYQNKV